MNDLSNELTQLVHESEQLLAMCSKLEKSPVIDKTFSKEMATLAAQMMAHSRQAAKALLA